MILHYRADQSSIVHARHDNVVARAMMHLGAFAVAGLLLVGRWAPARLVEYGTQILGGELLAIPRTWLLAGLVLYTMLVAAKNAMPTVGSVAIKRPVVVGLLSLFVIIAYWCVTAAWAISPVLAMDMDKLFDLLFILAVMTCLYILLRVHNGAVFIDVLWKYLIILAACLGLLAIAAGSTDDSGRAAALGGGPITFGRIMVVLLLGSLSMMIARNLMGIPLFLIALVMLLLSGSRGPFLAGIIGVTVYSLLEFAAIARRGLLVTFAVLGATFIIGNTSLGSQASERFWGRIVNYTLSGDGDAGRSMIMENALAVASYAPVWGNGLDAYKYFDSNFSYPHNLFLEIYVDGGGVGLFLMATAVLLCFWTILANITLLHKVTFATYCAMLFSVQLSGDIYDSRWVFWLPFLCLVPRTESADTAGRDSVALSK
jgi:O-antigen ligase